MNIYIRQELCVPIYDKLKFVAVIITKKKKIKKRGVERPQSSVKVLIRHWVMWRARCSGFRNPLKS